MSLNEEANDSNISDDYYVVAENGGPPVMNDPKFLVATTVVWLAISFVGIAANLCVIVVTFCCWSIKKSATQYFITNLAISDMLFLLISPTLALINLHDLISFNHLPYFVGVVICKADYYLTHVRLTKQKKNDFNFCNTMVILPHVEQILINIFCRSYEILFFHTKESLISLS